jgi:hypothetical protein
MDDRDICPACPSQAGRIRIGGNDRRTEGETGMSTINRRGFLGTASMMIAAAQFGTLASANAQSRPRSTGGTKTSFASLKQVDAGVLSIGYAEAGPATGPAVVLLHGWPYDFTATSTWPPCWHRRATA